MHYELIFCHHSFPFLFQIHHISRSIPATSQYVSSVKSSFSVKQKANHLSALTLGSGCSMGMLSSIELQIQRNTTLGVQRGNMLADIHVQPGTRLALGSRELHILLLSVSKTYKNVFILFILWLIFGMVWLDWECRHFF